MLCRQIPTWSLLILSIYLNVPVAGRISDTLFSLAVSKSARNRPSGEAVVEFDEFGGLPQLLNTYQAIAKSSTIVAIRSTNATLLSYTAKNVSTLQIPIGAQSLNSLNNPQQYLLITGLAGDARSVIRHAKQVALNYTIAFESVPSGRYIAEEVGKFLQGYTVQAGMRPLACHTFIADGVNEKSLYEIDAAGNVAQIWAGVAGGNMAAGRNILESRLNCTAVSSIAIAEELSDSILSVSSAKQKNSTDANDSDSLCGDERNRGAFHTVHFVLHDNVSGI
jgi:20S proteasome alpha/beta subunit